MAEPRYVPVIAPDGSKMEVPEDRLADAVNKGGFQVDPSAQYEGQGARALLEGVGRGATLGLADTAQVAGAGLGTKIGNYFADLAGYGPTERATGAGLDAGVETIDRSADADKAMREAKADIQGRREANSGLATAGELGGGLLLGVATGGLGTSGLAARGTTALGKAGYSALAGGLEGAAYGAAKAADDDFLADRDITAERIMMGAKDGLLLGGGLAGGASLLGSGIGYVAGKAREKVASLLDTGPGWGQRYLDKLMGESAYKAAVGRTSKRGIQAAERHGGAEAVGNTLLREGIDLTQDAEGILAQTTAKADEVGAQLGAKAAELDALGQAGPSRSGLRDLIEEKILKPLDEGTFSESTATTVRGKLQRMMDKLSTADRPVLVRGPAGERVIARDAMSFDEMRDMRIELDKELANWNSFAAEKGPLEAYRDTRRLMEDYWLQSADDAAQKAGITGFADNVKSLKETYAHLALARDQAQEAVLTQLANRATSASDYAAGIGTAMLTGDPITGFLASQAHGFIRERGRGILATALYRARQRAALGEQVVEDAAGSLFATAKAGARKVADRTVSALPIAGVILKPGDAQSYERVIERLVKLQDPASEERSKLRQQQAEMSGDSPDHAAALDAYTDRTVNFLLAKAGASSLDLTRPFGNLKKPTHDRGKAIALARYAKAAQNPQAALRRIGDGTGTREDVEAIKELAPRLWARFQGKVASRLTEMNEPPSYEERLRLGQVLDQPMTYFATPDFQQRIATTPAQPSAQQSKPSGGYSQLSDANNSQSGSDQILTRGE